MFSESRGGTILIAQFVPDLRRLRRAGVILLLVSGTILFWLQPARYYNSISFQVKVVLLVLLLRIKPASILSLVVWAAIIFASRGIAFW
jgi:hypothetical protein